MPTVTVTGDKELMKQLAKLAKQASGPQADEALDRPAELLADRMRDTSAFQDNTGTLRKSITVKRDKKRGDYERKVGPTAPHAHLVEFGTSSRRTVPADAKALKFGERFSMYTVSKMAARPFIRPAFEEAKEEMLKEYREALKEMLQP